MTDYNYFEDVQIGLEANQKADKNRQEIKSVIDEITQMFQERLGIDLKLRNIFTFNGTLNFSTISKTSQPERIISLHKDGKSEDIASIKESDKGYPVHLSYDGNHNICGDISALKSEFSSLFKTAYFGKKLQKLQK
ncbi:hypothetical protein ACT41M_06055 [Acinetobacter baumannii]|nr:hypothetical protein [Acinetobacter baumannii]